MGHEWLPGIAAIVLGGGLAVTGFAHLGAGTGLVCAALAGPLGAVSAPAGCTWNGKFRPPPPP